MAAAKPKPIPNDGRSIPGSGGPSPDEVEPVYTREEVVANNKVVAMSSQKKTVLEILYQEKLAANAPAIITDTILYIMADYGFVILKPKEEEKKDVS